MPKSNRALFQFYLLVVYILLQFLWWAFLIASLNAEVRNLKLELRRKSNNSETQLTKELDQELHKRWLMIGGEGSVFLSILFLGIYQTRKSFQRESRLALQQRNFILSVTHELKTPLASLRLQIETLKRRTLTQEAQGKVLQFALDETERLNSLVEKVLLANSIEGKGLLLNKTAVDTGIISEWLGNLATSPWLQQHQFTFFVFNGIVSTDLLAIQSIMNNLLENAAKYSPPGSFIHLDLIQTAQGFELIIQDNGPGIPKEFSSLVFQKFYRLGNEETRSAKGTGLGLYIVDNLVKALGGTCELMFPIEGGTRFRMTFT